MRLRLSIIDSNINLIYARYAIVDFRVHKMANVDTKIVRRTEKTI